VDYLLDEHEDSGNLGIKFNRPERMNAEADDPVGQRPRSRLGHGHDLALRHSDRLRTTRFIGFHNAGHIIENGRSYYLPKIVRADGRHSAAGTMDVQARHARRPGQPA
jgi:hypothetical protein